MDEKETQTGIPRARRHTPDLRAWLLVVLLALAVRAVYLYQYAPLPRAHIAVGPDVEEYAEWARDILGGEILWNRVRIHAPVYPYVLAGLHLLFRGNLIAIRGAQLLLNVVGMLFFCAALGVRGRRRTAWIAGLIWALSPPLVFYPAELVSEGPGLTIVCMVWWACESALWRLRTRCSKIERACMPGRRIAAPILIFLGAGIAGGLAICTHPLAAGPIGALVVYSLLQLRRIPVVRTAATALFVAGCVLPVGFVTLRNYAVNGRFVLIQGHAGLNAYIGNGPGATGLCRVPPGVRYRRFVQMPERHGLPPSQSDAWFLRETMQYIRRRPLHWLGLFARKLLLTWNARDLPAGDDVPRRLYSHIRLLRLPLPGFWFVGPLALAALTIPPARRRAGPAGIIVGLHTLLLGLLVTSGRYRLLMIPGAVALAAALLDTGFHWYRSHRRRLRTVTAYRLVRTAALVLGGSMVVFAPIVPSSDAAIRNDLIRTEALYRGGRLNEAAAVARRIVDSRPDDPDAWHLYALILDDSGRREQALNACRRAHRLAPDDPEILMNLAVLLSETGRRDAALDRLLGLLHSYPRLGKAWYNLGVVLQSMGRFERAVAAYRQAVRLQPGLASAHLNLGILLQNRGRLEEALTHLKAAVRIAPSRANAWDALAVCYAAAGRRREAIHCFERSLRMNPRQPAVWAMYIDFLNWCGDKESAEKAARRAQTVLRGSLPQRHGPDP